MLALNTSGAKWYGKFRCNDFDIITLPKYQNKNMFKYIVADDEGFANYQANVIVWEGDVRCKLNHILPPFFCKLILQIWGNCFRNFPHVPENFY